MVLWLSIVFLVLVTGFAVMLASERLGRWVIPPMTPGRRPEDDLDLRDDPFGERERK